MTDIVERLRDIGGHMINAADRREAADEIERWRDIALGDSAAKAGVAADLHRRLEELRARHSMLKDALDFYADRQNWINQKVDYGGNFTDVANSAPAFDGGRQARAALSAATAA